MKKFTALVIGTLIAISGLFAIMLTPFHAPNFVRANPGGFVPFSLFDHELRTNMRIENLPRRTATVGEAIGLPTTTADFLLVRTSGARDFIVGSSNGVFGAIPTTFTYAGNYEFRFYNEITALMTEDMLLDRAYATFIAPFHTYTVTVTQNEFSFTLPENCGERWERVTNTANPYYVMNRVNFASVPTVSVAHLPITLPLPTSFVDRNGNDLFLTRRTIEGRWEVPNLRLLENLYRDQITANQAAYDALDTLGRLDWLKQRVFEDTVVRFYGNDGEINNVAGTSGVPLSVAGVTSPLTRTFIPEMASTLYYAEFTFNANGLGIDVGSFRTRNINVENIGDADAVARARGWEGTPANDQIRFDFMPSVPFAPPGVQLGVEVELPRPTVNVSTETDRDSNRYSPVRFNSTETAPSFTFIVAEILRDGSQEWETAVDIDGNYFDFITDFRFTPTELGEYRFWYFTTTLLGGGFDHSQLSDVVVAQNAQGVWVHPNNAPARATTFMRYMPFGRLFVRSNTVAPLIQWTGEFNYTTAGNAVTRPDVGISYAGNTPINFESAPDYARYLPGTGANSRTQIASTQIGVGDRNENRLILPALLGHTNNPNMSSRDLTYSVTIRRIVEGQQHRDSVTFASNIVAPSGSSFFYDNTSRLEIIFNAGVISFVNGYQRDTNGMPTGIPNTGVITAELAPTGSIETRYDITVFARDERIGEGAGMGLPSGQLFYSFVVVPVSQYNMDDEVPTFPSGILLRQTEYYQDDTISFRQVNPSDQFTDDRNIAISYILSFPFNGGTEFADITDYAEIVGGFVELPLVAGSSDIADLLLEALNDADGFLEVTLFAVARNYFALKNNFQFDATALTQESGIAYVTANFRLYSLQFGYAALILADYTTGVQTEWDEQEWDDAVEDANLANPEGIQQYHRVYIPAFHFMYDTLPANAQDGIATTITFEIVQPISGRVISPTRGSWQGLLTDDESREISGLSFVPNEVGAHTLVVRVTNAGGNISVFKATILVFGVPHYSVGIIGGVESMVVGQNVSLPTIVITIAGREFRTNSSNQVVTAAPITVGLVTFPAGTVVGNYSIWGESQGGQPVTHNNNRFTPTEAGTFSFEFDININMVTLASLVQGVNPARAINPTVTHRIVVSQLRDGDVAVVLDGSRYLSLFADLRDNALVGSIIDSDGNVIPTPPSGAIPPTGRIITADNLLTQFTPVGGSVGGEFPLSDAQLERGLRQLTDSANAPIGEWEYGIILLPDFFAEMRNGLGAPEGFSANVTQNITVQGPRARDGEYLLDTREDDESRFVTLPSGQRLFYFQPQGRLDGNDLTNADPSLRAQPINRDVRVDGIYIITYTVTFQNVTATLEFRISIGDVAEPIFGFHTGIAGLYEDDIFNTTYVLNENDLFILDTNIIRVDPNGGKTDFSHFYVASNITIEFIRPTDNSTVPVGSGTYDVHRLHATDDDIRNDQIAAQRGFDGRQEYRIRFNEAGNWRINFHIESEAGVPAFMTRTIRVEMATPDTPVSPEQIWGIILIIFSIGLFIGIVAYFVISGRNIKFAGQTSKAKGASAPKEKPDEV
ncbi:MAG: hypothetical protein FWE16_00545 [Firmicutes bacterium]|nr:hypothetical protein [Bacillota bacterium]